MELTAPASTPPEAVQTGLSHGRAPAYLARMVEMIGGLGTYELETVATTFLLPLAVLATVFWVLIRTVGRHH